LSTYRDLKEISELLDVSSTKLRRWIDRLDIEPAVRAAHGRHLFDDPSVQLLQGIKEHLEAGWDLNKLVHLFGPSSATRHASPTLGSSTGASESSSGPLREEMQAMNQRLDQLLGEVAVIRREMTQRELETRALMEALTRLASAISVNTALLEELDARLPSVLLGRT
jgi:DNA-binding transcriptional MerR regulator